MKKLILAQHKFKTNFVKAIRIHRHGDTSVLSLDTVPEPQVAAGQVKVQVHASSINRMDLWVRQGIPGIGPLPLILGCDGAGVVAECGAGVTSWQKSDRVLIYPLLNFLRADSYEAENANLSRHLTLLGEQVDGTHCEFICLPATHLLKIPDNLSFTEAASFPLTFLTAWHMLVRKGRIQKDQDVLIVAAASGIGVAAVQIAKHFGARVIATSSGTERLQRLRDLGADVVMDHYQESLAKGVKAATRGKGVELIFEHVGASVWAECLKALAWGGRLVTCGATSGPDVAIDLRHLFIKQQEILGSTMGTIDELGEINRLMAQGKLHPVVDKVFSYLEVAKAHDYLETKKPFGKVVLNWA